MRRPAARFLAFLLIAASAAFSACGGGGESGTTGGGGPSYPSKVLRWTPPDAYTDNTTLNPVAELANFEIYVKESGAFSDSDSPMALVAAIDPNSQQLVTSFNLANLGPYLSAGVRYQVSVRAVALSGARSDFSSPASFSF